MFIKHPHSLQQCLIFRRAVVTIEHGLGGTSHGDFGVAEALTQVKGIVLGHGRFVKTSPFSIGAHRGFRETKGGDRLPPIGTLKHRLLGEKLVACVVV
jgi:hypothetical protein